MPMSSIRLNFIQPGCEPNEMAARYQAGLDMVELADKSGFTMISLEEHHGAENGWSSTPLLLAGLIFGRAKKLTVTLCALLLPLHDPLRVAEDVAVLDLASGGRFSFVVGLGYRPIEYAAARKDWASRGKIMDECVQALLDAWTGEPFEYHGEIVRVTPRPVTQPHPLVFIGGSNRVSARRAARFGLPYFPPANLPELETYYYEQCAERGVEGFCVTSDVAPVMRFVTEDPDKAWAELGKYFLEEAVTYHGWQTPDITSSVNSKASTVEELRKEGIYSFVTPDECIAAGKEMGDAGAIMLHPLCGGMPIDDAWSCMQLYVDKVLPAFS